MKATQKILVPTDFSTYADKALEEAISLGKQFHSEIILLHVVDDLQQCFVDYCLPEEMVEGYRQTALKTAKEKLQGLTWKYKDVQEVTLTSEVRIGIPFSEILKAEQDKNIDLIVIASHGKTGFMHSLIGSVADRVSKGAKCPVMLIKA
ncbi:MAG: universal stress protein [Syntrophales bacterium]|nr:universal stress protein [Syntrophales bacterium]